MKPPSEWYVCEDSKRLKWKRRSRKQGDKNQNGSALFFRRESMKKQETQKQKNKPKPKDES